MDTSKSTVSVEVMVAPDLGETTLLKFLIIGLLRLPLADSLSSQALKTKQTRVKRQTAVRERLFNFTRVYLSVLMIQSHRLRRLDFFV